MAASVYQDLEDFVTCEICYDVYEGRELRSLTCQHIFCISCIQKIVNVTKKQSYKLTDDISCPTCKSTVAIPGGAASKLPVYFKGDKVHDILKQMKQKHSICKICETTTHKGEVVSYCFQCTMAFCDTCHTKHDLRHSNHTQVEVSASTIAYLMCPDHEKHVESFCMDCDRTVCGACSLGAHSDHCQKELSWDSDESNELDKVFIDHLDSADQLTTLATIKDTFNTHMDKTIDQLDKHHKAIMKQMKRQRKSFHAQLQQSRDQVNQNLETTKVLIEQGKACVKKLHSQTRSWRRPIPAMPGASITDIQDIVEGIKHKLPSAIPIEEPVPLEFVPSDLVSLGDIVEKMRQNTTIPEHGTQPKPQWATSHRTTTRNRDETRTHAQRVIREGTNTKSPAWMTSEGPEMTGNITLLHLDTCT